ncbi:MAG: glycosyltransferase family 2 protein [Thiobacillus sp.]|nr:glycosyltransferase family 2 protein [Thiobacillus sp.]
MQTADLNPATDADPVVISVVAPAYNEEAVLPEFHKRLCAVFEGLDCELEVVYVNDGSTDQTFAVLNTLRAQDARITLVDLSRNFGKEIAMTAGFDHACGDAVVVIDTDLQDPPELIPEMIRMWRAGHDIVYAQRTVREGESWMKRATASAFYRVIQRLSRVRIPQDTGDFRLMSRRAVDALLQLREHHRFMKGLFAWVGFPQVALPYRRDARFAGDTKWNYWKLWNFAIEGITSFTTVPLKIASYMGLLISLFAFGYAAVIIYKTLMFGESVQGYPSLMVAILMLGGIQLASLGIIGEYLGRMFNETKRRPLYLTQGVQLSRHAGQPIMRKQTDPSMA